MPNELTVIPTALEALEHNIASREATIDDLLLPLRALQRLGLSRTDLQVIVERMRAVNDVTSDDEVIEENATLALDLITGTLANFSLRWDPAEVAKINMPRALNLDNLDPRIPIALAPSNMLPPRPGWNLSVDARQFLLNRLRQQLQSHSWEPQRADFFRVPKAGMTTRPAALLAPRDRLIFQGLAECISENLDSELPTEVFWPRTSDPTEAPYEEFATLPRRWRQKYVVMTDIESFYECIDHSVLVTFISARLHDQTPYLRALEAFLDTIMGSSVGLPQGPVASDAFASAYLLPVDEAMSDAAWTFARFADDYLIGAESVVDGRKKLELLESTLREVGLRLNVAKTRVMRTDTYLGFLDKPSRRVERLRERVRELAEEHLRETQDEDEVETLLRDIGVDEEILWDLLYHQTITMEEVIEQIRDQLRPSLVEAYKRYFDRAARSLARGRLPEDMLSAEKDLRECLTFLASGQRLIDLKLLDRTLNWFPRLARHASAYLNSIAPNARKSVTRLLGTWLQPHKDTDWVTAWLCYVAESTPQLVTDDLARHLSGLAVDPSVGFLTRTGAVRALAAAGKLDIGVWRRVLSEATPSVRSELVLGRLAEPHKYPGDLAALKGSNDGFDE